MSEELDRLAFTFFKLFAQYEYALKAMKYAHVGRYGQVELEWDRYSNEIGKLILIDDDEHIQRAVNYLFDNPPKKQVIRQGKLDWKSVNTEVRSPKVLFEHIRRVRNNLYHGGKFNDNWLEPQRSTELISNSLIILQALKEKDANLAAAIHGNCPNKQD